MAWILGNEGDRTGVTTNPTSINVLFDYDQLETLTKILLNPASIGLQGLWSKPTDWLSRLMYIPFRPSNIDAGTLGLFNVAEGFPVIDTHIKIGFADPGNQVYTLGEYYVERHFNNFADYNGYTKIDLYLPFLGFVSVNPNDVIGKYIQIRLSFDNLSGQGTYIIGVSDNSITHENRPVADRHKDLYVRILSTHIVQLGVEIPLGSTNAGEIARNMLLGTLKVAGTALAYKTALDEGAFTRTTSTKQTKTFKRKKDGRLKIVGRNTTVTDSTTDISNYEKFRMKNACFSTAMSTLNSMHLDATSDKPHNMMSLVDCSLNAYVVIYRPRFVQEGADYAHLYGYPYGASVKLNTMGGYTEISAIHLEGDAFNNITDKERSMLMEIFNDGIILPTLITPTITFTVDGNSYDCYSGETWIEWITRTTPVGFRYDDSKVYYNDKPINNVVPSDVIMSTDYITETDNYEFYVKNITTDEVYRYAFDNGMTWSDFIDSDYNINNIFGTEPNDSVDDTPNVTINGRLLKYDGVFVNSSSVIVSGRLYEYEGETVTEINFTVDGDVFSCVQGRTWAEWIDTSTDAIGFRYDNTAVYYNDVAIENVVFTDVIEAKEYRTVTQTTFYFSVRDTTTSTTKSFTAGTGMTWLDFISSPYNTNNAFTVTNDVVYYNTYELFYSGSNVSSSSLIVEDAIYRYETPKRLSFTINGNTYYYQDGWDWRYFISSPYNTNDIFYTYSNSLVYVMYDNNFVMNNGKPVSVGQDISSIEYTTENSRTISNDIWVFNSTISTIPYTLYFNFSNYKISKKYYHISTAGDYIRFFDGTFTLNAYSISQGWLGDFRYVSIGANCKVPQSTYNWFTSNASIYVEPEEYIITSGGYTFKSVLTPIDTTQIIPFRNGTNICSSITIETIGQEGAESYSLIMTYMRETSAGNIPLSVYNNVWGSHSYRTITVSTDTTVSKEFYEWFNSNIQ